MAITIRFDKMSDVKAFVGGLNPAGSPFAALMDLIGNSDNVSHIPFSAPTDGDDTPVAADTVADDSTVAHTPALGDPLTMDQIGRLVEGDRVHWEGRKYQFDGELVDDTDDNDNDYMYIRIRRDDTGKIVKVTFDAAETGKLYKL